MSIERKKERRNIFEYINNLFENLHALLTKELEDIFEFGSITKPSWDIDEECCFLEPMADIRTTKDEVIIIIDLPKVRNKENIELNVSKNSIEVRAYLDNKVCYEKWGGYQRKVEFCEFRKTFNIPWEIDPDNVKAKFKNGILEIRAKRTEKYRSIKIED
ncbi:MAG: Hsp20/alpha crystallin family protein [Candidatus Helarchaeota archaeon]